MINAGILALIAQARIQSQRLCDEYYAKHRRCPVCVLDKNATGGFVGSQTYIGYIMNPEHPELFKDMNEARCNCGWVGTVHQLV